MDTQTIRSSLFTRQQIGQLAGVDDSSLNYWMREGLLRAVEGGSGKGNHRRFEYVQVNIAVVFGQLRRFGINIAALRSLAELMQSAAQLGASVQLDVSNYTTAAWLANKLNEFRRGKPVMVEPNWMKDNPAGMSRLQVNEWMREKRPATDEQDLLNHLLSRTQPDYDGFEAILAAAELIGPGREEDARIYTDLVADILRPGYSEEVTWLLGLREDGTWDLESGSQGRFFESLSGRGAGDFGSGVFIPLGALLRKMWALKSPEEIRRERQAEYAEEKLAAAGLIVKVTPAVDDDSPMTVEFDAPITIEQIEEVLSRRAWMTRKEEAK